MDWGQYDSEDVNAEVVDTPVVEEVVEEPIIDTGEWVDDVVAVVAE